MMKNIFFGLSLLMLGGCGSTRPSKYRALDKDGNEIVNAFTIAADWMMYFGIMAVIAGILMIVILKMVKTGGLSIIAGIACFVFAQFLNYIGSHLGIFITAAVAITVLAGFLYYKAITTGLPWLEKIMNKDLNRDGFVGEKSNERDVLPEREIIQ